MSPPLQSVRVVMFCTSIENGKRVTEYVTEVNDGNQAWDVNIRYSRYYDFHEKLLQNDKNVVTKLPFPSKDLFANHSPEYRQAELDKFVIELLAAFESLTEDSQIMFLNLLDVGKHSYSDDDHHVSKDDVSTLRVSKQSISSTTTTELEDDNQRDSISDSQVDDHPPLSPVQDGAPEDSPRHYNELGDSCSSDPLDGSMVSEGDELNDSAEVVDMKELAPEVSDDNDARQPSDLFMAIQQYQLPDQVHFRRHIWTKATTPDSDRAQMQCWLIVVMTLRVLYPSLLYQSNTTSFYL